MRHAPSPRSHRRSALAIGVAIATLLVACGAERGHLAGGGGDADPVVEPGAVPAIVPATEPIGTVTHATLSFDGRERTYRLYVPSRLPAGPVPLFVALHGGTGWGDQFATTNHVEGLAESNGFVVVHPDGVTVGAGPGGVWNGGICCAVAVREGVDDVGFVDALIAQLETEQNIDPQQVYAFGHSNGAIMSYRLACQLSDRIVGIGVVAGVLGVEACAPSQPVSVIQVHGKADDNVPFAGGVGPKSLVGVDFPPPHDGFDALASADGCPPVTTEVDGDLTIESAGPCDAGTAATFVAIETANHAWPGGTPIIEPAVGPGYAAYDATTEIVAFLLAHPRP